MSDLVLTFTDPAGLPNVTAQSAQVSCSDHGVVGTADASDTAVGVAAAHVREVHSGAAYLFAIA